MILKSKIAIITGAASGIGKEAAFVFAREGASVVVADFNSEGGEESVRIIRETGGEACFIYTDVRIEESVKEMVTKTVERYGRLDIIYNNAGIDRAKPLVETSEEDWKDTIDTNLKGVFLGCKYAIPVMVKQGGGVILCTTSILAHIASANQAAYCASKGGVVSMMRQIALDYAKHNIRANCISPADVMTPLNEKYFQSCENPEERRRFFLEKYPMSRFAQPSEIASVALFLASDASSFITGQAIQVEGGFSIS